MTEQDGFWPGGARLTVSVSMQFEAGGQPVSGAGGPITEPILPGFPDLGQNSFYEYGAREGVPRILDLLDKHDIKMTSFMIGDAVRRHPGVAAEIVRRGPVVLIRTRSRSGPSTTRTPPPGSTATPLRLAACRDGVPEASRTPHRGRMQHGKPSAGVHRGTAAPFR
jgi:peptidoglycan/xylan/chitin deacetylase (PgdA/CDA1 family)